MLEIHLSLVLILIINIFTSILGFKNQSFFNKYKFQIGKIKSGENFRLLTSGFLHVNFNHLLINMLSLYFFTGYIVYSLGELKFLAIYFSSLFLGNYLSLKFHEEQNDYTAVGASGAVSGVVYSAVLLYPDMKMAFLLLPIPLPGYIIATLYLIYTIYGMKKQNDNIGHTAHFGGAISGIISTVAFFPSVIKTSSFTIGILSLTIVVTGYLFNSFK